MSSQTNPDANATSAVGNPRLKMVSFPPEILCEIFLACIPAIGNSDQLPAYFPFGISHVCRHWRTSALAFPKIWSFLDVEQTQENQEGDCPEFYLMEAYLERSGNHPLTFRLALTNETMHYQTFLECLEKHAARWQNVFLENPDHYHLEHLAQGDPSDYPMLRSLVCTYCDLDQDCIQEGPIFGPFPWSQLKHYHEYEVSWSPDCERQWEIISQLTNVVDLRASFYGEYEDESPIEMPHLRFASIAIDKQEEELDIEDILNCFDFPGIQGLNLKLMDNHPVDALSPVPNQLKGLKILRLCGSLAISNDALKGILTEIETLTDFAIELRGIDAGYLFQLLTPSTSELVPHLRALRTTHFRPVADEALDVLLGMLRERFGVARLQRFEFFLGPRPFSILSIPPEEWESFKTVPSTTMFDKLEAMRVDEGWDIRVDRDWQEYDFWREEMDGKFL
ncbi:hypothetical protein MVEN_02012000 [Mycena venus]|uniref:F-box domain-containing protein n=1 Tax=Mycena venus TaxID=2733690 RepID=A0A8H6XBX0_9AGAR|nr:hypothetical protein MVEN_02012000 [Mycena venus]